MIRQDDGQNRGCYDKIQIASFVQGDFRVLLQFNYIGKLSEKRYRIEKHHHFEWEVIYYTEGHGIIDFDGKKVPFEPNDIFIIPPHLKHTEYSDEGFKNYNLVCTGYNFPDTAYINFKDSNNGDILALIKQMYMEVHLKRKNWSNIINSLNELIYQYMVALAEVPEQNYYVSKAINIMINNISNPSFDINALLQKIPLHKDYFRKLFSDSTGVTPLHFMTQKRISYAKQLLSARKSVGLNIKEIAMRSGFSDPYYFSRVFKKETGVSPANWSEL